MSVNICCILESETVFLGVEGGVAAFSVDVEGLALSLWLASVGLSFLSAAVVSSHCVFLVN